MVPAHPTMAGVEPDPETRYQRRGDPVRIAVHFVLALYLMPVVLLVAAIGVTSIVVSQAIRLATRGTRLFDSGPSNSTDRGLAANRRLIGIRPIAKARGVRSRISR